ncbi:acyl-CoA dehydrogenase family protein [Nocardia goodfellowii]|uniref:Alkylation response protein AidB-like acyl-CoA dehydrogenase n=1 Tax=Nocardia goodfellowii TaxID=882446 RepID=A0ABS4QIQ6_9NOCA|nr:acyl-CoA dehydrogenase family protein [Nocardia goodfellowii]MBP2191584.1 alkylation response protein AidB-like acyl-CoA dehydrogenase [Nocardia goodfellowii]
MIAPSHPMARPAVLRRSRGLRRALIAYSPATMWERDTAKLPLSLRGIRRRYRKFADQVLAPVALDLDSGEPPPLGEWDPRLRHIVKAAGRQGLMTDMFPQPIGSLNPLALRYMVWAQALKTEEFARACGGLALVLNCPTLGAIPLLLSGSLPTYRRFVLPVARDIKNGEPHLLSLALSEPGSGSDLENSDGARSAQLQTTAKRVRGGWQLNGQKRFISGADLARTIVTFAALEGEGPESITGFVLHPDMPGFTLDRRELKMGQRASGTARLAYRDIFVPDSHVVGGLRDGWALVSATLNYSRIPVAGVAVGLAQAATDAALAFAARYRLAGKKLLEYQQIQLQLAQMITETTAIRGFAWFQARDFKPHQAEASMSKFHCSDRAVAVCHMAMDLMGNNSLLHVNRVEKAFRDARVTQIYEGTNQINRLAVFEDLQEEIFAQGAM